MRYKAFISYSHADKAVAERLEGALQAFGKAWYQPRARRVFRDDSNIQLGPLRETVISAIDESEYFLLLASPTAAQSEWVGREVRSWLERHGTEKLLIALTTGQLEWDHSRTAFDRAETTALPAPLLEAFPEEPLWADLTGYATPTELTFDDPRFKNTVAQLAATVEAKSLEDMIGAEIEQHNRTRRIRNSAVVTLSLLLVLAIIFAGLATWQTRVARQERAEAERQRDRALSRQLATASREAVERSDWSLGGLLALESLRRDWTPAGFEAWQEALERLPAASIALQAPGSVFDLHFSADGTLLLGRSANSLLRWDLGTSPPEMLREPHSWRAGARNHPVLAFDATGLRLVTADGERLRLWDARTLDSTSWDLAYQEVISAAISPDGQWVAAVSRQAPGLRVWRAAESGTPRIAAEIDDGDSIMAYAFSPDSKWLAAGTRRSIHVWELTSGAAQTLAESEWGRSWGPLAFSPDHQWLVNWQGTIWRTGTWDIAHQLHPGTYRQMPTFSPRRWLTLGEYGLRVLSAGTGEPNSSLPEIPGQAPVFSPDDRWVATRDGKVVYLGDLTGDVEVRRIERADGGPLTFSPDSRWLAGSSNEGMVYLWQPEKLRERSRLVLGSAAVAMAFSPDSTRLATADSGSVRLWNLDSRAFEVRAKAALSSAGRSGTSWNLVRLRGSERVALTRGGGEGEKVFETVHAPRLERALFSPDGRWAAVAEVSSTWKSEGSRLWDLDLIDARQIAGVPTAFTPDSRSLLSYSHDDGALAMRVQPLDFASPAVSWELEPAGWHRSTDPVVAFAPDRSTALIGSGTRKRDRTMEPLSGRLSVHDVRDWSLRYEIAYRAPVAAVDTSPDGELVALAKADGELLVLQADDGKERWRAEHEGSVVALSFSEDGSLLRSIDGRGQASVWRSGNGRSAEASASQRWRTRADDGWQRAQTRHPPDSAIWDEITGRDAITDADLSPDERWLATAGKDDMVTIWAVPGGERRAQLPHRGPIRLKFDDAGSWLAIRSNYEVCAWSVETWQRSSCSRHTKTVNRMVFSPTGAVLASSGVGSVRLQRLDDSGRMPILRHEGGVRTIAFGNDDSLLVTATDAGELGLWQLPAGEAIMTTTLGDPATAAALSPDHWWLAVVVAGEVRVLEVATGIEIGRFRLAEFDDVRFSSDGNTIFATAGDEEHLLPWSTEALAAATCSRLQRNFSWEEWRLYGGGELYEETCSELALHPSLRAEADRRIEQGEFEAAVELIGTIGRIEGVAPEPTAEHQAAPALVVRGSQLARRGLIAKAIESYSAAHQWNSKIEISARAWNTLCWYGSLWGEPEPVLEHCNSAVALGEFDGGLRDSRGLARALTGDLSGAIEDFQSYIDETDRADEKKDLRRDWIRELKAGRNPITPEVLEQLRDEQGDFEAFL